MTERAFNPHGNRTADGVLVTVGLEVYTNNLDRGVVTHDSYDGDYGRTGDHWYTVKLHTSYTGEPKTGATQMNGERMCVRKPF